VASKNDRQGEPEPEGDDLDDESWDLTYHHSPFVRELRRLKELDNYQRRGYEFEEFVASLFRRRHFKVIRNPGTAKPRQTDLLAKRGDESYLIETKWRSSKVDIDDIDSLFARLEATPASVVGLMVSFSGFTGSVIERVEQRSDRPVLLMTGEELERLVEWDEDLVHFLALKKTSLLTNRTAFFAASRRGRVSHQPSRLATAPAEFAFPDGSRAKWITGKGGFGEFTFVEDLPDIDWSPGEGRGVILDMPVPVYDERGILTLLYLLSSMGWATKAARWSIQQSATNWHGMGMSAFAEALQGWRQRHKGIPTHHSEEFCYFDNCDGGFYCLTANISAHKDRSATYTLLSFQLTGIPLDTEPFKELSRAFDAGYSCYFRPMKRRSVKKQKYLPEPYRVQLEPIAFIVEQDDVFGDKRDWTRGIVARNPFYRPNSSLAERKPGWLPPHVFDSDLLICDLRSWHLLSEPKPRYELWGCESARTADAVIVHLIAEWPDQDNGPTEEVAPRRFTWRSDQTEMVQVDVSESRHNDD
jgi:Holliday junction resolvase